MKVNKQTVRKRQAALIDEVFARKDAEIATLRAVLSQAREAMQNVKAREDAWAGDACADDPCHPRGEENMRAINSALAAIDAALGEGT